MAVIDKINELLDAAATEGVEINTLTGQLLKRYNDTAVAYPTFTFSQWNYISTANFRLTRSWLGDTPVMDFSTAYNRAWNYAMAEDPGWFFVHILEAIRALQKDNASLLQFRTKSAILVLYGEVN